MPAGDKTGPLGQGPYTGRRGGNPPPRLGRQGNAVSQGAKPQRLSVNKGEKNASRR